MNDRYVIRFCVCAQNAIDEDIIHAYEVISQLATDLFEILKLDPKSQIEEGEQKIEKEEDESVDEVFMLDRKKKMSLRYKRSFFVRMVSDPKLYNPKIVKALSTGNRRHTSDDSNNDVVTPL